VSRPSALPGFEAFVARFRDPVEAALQELLPPAEAPPAPLHTAMRYAMFPGGKRLRPMLALLGSAATGGEPARALGPAAAIECLHTYSLLHDDLPCMDDDDLRRGRPTCHKVHGEATALLAGDALLALAFEGVARAGPDAVARLARAAGSLGMVGGQSEDLAAQGGSGERSLARVQWIHDRKTGALIQASLMVGALAGTAPGAAPPARALDLLERYGGLLGRAFQIADDCLDLTASSAQLGKDVRADAAHGKLTFPSVLGLERSLAAAEALAREAAGLAPEIVAAAGGATPVLDGAAGLLQDCALYAVRRRS
jgi:geranylgeranyl pyrophosphate synthase